MTFHHLGTKSGHLVYKTGTPKHLAYCVPAGVLCGGVACCNAGTFPSEWDVTYPALYTDGNCAGVAAKYNGKTFTLGVYSDPFGDLNGGCVGGLGSWGYYGGLICTVGGVNLYQVICLTLTCTAGPICTLQLQSVVAVRLGDVPNNNANLLIHAVSWSPPVNCGLTFTLSYVFDSLGTGCSSDHSKTITIAPH